MVPQALGSFRKHDLSDRGWLRDPKCARITAPLLPTHGAITSRRVPAAIEISIHSATTVDRHHCLFRLFYAPIVGGMVDIRSDQDSAEPNKLRDLHASA